MSEQEFTELSEKIDKGLQTGYENLLRSKAALGLDVIIADENGMPISVPAAELLKKNANM